MSKKVWKAGTFIYPIPAALVTSGDMENSNILTVAWTGILNTNPAIVYISVRPERYSYNLIKENREFVINLTNENLAFETDWCGVRSGAKFDKFKEMNLTKEKANFVKAPLIKESPVSIECKVIEERDNGSHTMFLTEVLSIDADDKYIDEKGTTNLTDDFCKKIVSCDSIIVKSGNAINTYEINKIKYGNGKETSVTLYKYIQASTSETSNE